MHHAFNCMNPLCFVYAENASCCGASWEPNGNDLEVTFPASSYGTASPPGDRTQSHMCIAAASECNNTDTPYPKHTLLPRSINNGKSSCVAHKQSRSTPPLIKPDFNNEAPQLTSLRHNKQCFDMVLNIPFPPTHTNTALHCVRPSRHHVMERCQLATCLTQTIGLT